MRGDQSPGNKASTGRQLLQPMDRGLRLRLRQYGLYFLCSRGDFFRFEEQAAARAKHGGLDLPHLFRYGMLREGLRLRRAR